VIGAETDMNDRSNSALQGTRFIWAGLLLGLGLGGFFDGIVLHQILQWHHMVSGTHRYPMTTFAGLKANTLGDGLFHAATLLMTLIGLWLLWSATRRPHGPWPTRLLVGLLLMGWGTFNLVEGVIDHHILKLHHVRQVSEHQGAWDIAFLFWGAVMLIGGWGLAKTSEQEMDAMPDAHRLEKSLPGKTPSS
jgi:uncharacterized membrane protein